MSVIRRLPRYYRFISELKNKGIKRISSKELAEMMKLTASQVRQDFNCFGGFGQQGYGYSIDQLHDEIENILGLDKIQTAVLIGAGNMGMAIATHVKFTKRGFTLSAIFDNDKSIIGKNVSGIEVLDVSTLSYYLKSNPVSTAILCIPQEAVPEVSQVLYSHGIRNFWNFSHYDLEILYDDIIMENVHLSDSLMTLCYRINDKNEKQKN